MLCEADHPPIALASRVAAGLSLGCSSDAAPCWWLEEAAEDDPRLWAAARMWETPVRFLASDQPNSGRGGHLGKEL